MRCRIHEAIDSTVWQLRTLRIPEISEVKWPFKCIHHNILMIDQIILEVDPELPLLFPLLSQQWRGQRWKQIEQGVKRKMLDYILASYETLVFIHSIHQHLLITHDVASMFQVLWIHQWANQLKGKKKKNQTVDVIKSSTSQPWKYLGLHVCWMCQSSCQHSQNLFWKYDQPPKKQDN